MKAFARVLFVAGALAIGFFLFRAAPRDVVLVYALGPREVSSVDVEVLRGAEVLRHAWLRPQPGGGGEVRHRVSLPDGEYRVLLRIAAPGRPEARVERTITVNESTTIVLPLQGLAAPR